MFDENSPEVINYVNQKLKEQSLNIAEKILDNYGDFHVGIIEKCIDISAEELDELLDGYWMKKAYKQSYWQGVILGRVYRFYRVLTHPTDLSLEQLMELLRVDQKKIKLEDWKSDPEKWAIAECKKWDMPKEWIIEELELTEEEFHEHTPNMSELSNYVPVFTGKEPTDDMVEKAYQRYLKARKNR